MGKELGRKAHGPVNGERDWKAQELEFMPQFILSGTN